MNTHNGTIAISSESCRGRWCSRDSSSSYSYVRFFLVALKLHLTLQTSCIFKQFECERNLASPQCVHILTQNMHLIDLNQSLVLDPDLAAAASLLIGDQERHLTWAVFNIFLLCRDFLLHPAYATCTGGEKPFRYCDLVALLRITLTRMAFLTNWRDRLSYTSYQVSATFNPLKCFS